MQVFLAQQALGKHLQSRAMSRLGSLLRIEIVLRVGPALPFQPLLSRVLSVQIVFYFEAHAACVILRAFANDQMVICVVHYGLRHQRGCAHAFQRTHGAGTLPWSMHAGRVQLHHAFSIGQSAIANTVIEWIQLNDIHSGY